MDKKLKCLRCGYEWFPLAGSTPKVCAKCKSYFYQKPSSRKPKEKHEN